jgi:ABC-type polysaccharide/polyol phosphate transport system ATPase subunit
MALVAAGARRPPQAETSSGTPRLIGEAADMSIAECRRHRPHAIVDTSTVVLIQNVSKVYHLYKRPSDRIFEVLPFGASRLHSEFWALRDINLHVSRGEIFALVGPNGSGKSTLLQVVAGILKPTRGRVVTEGRVAALLELGAGFNPEFTGRENVFMNSEIMGLSRKETEQAFPLIERFAEIGEFIDRPVKEYSTGMYIRLAFSTAIHVEPEILIVDEALAVGDAIFASRCIQKFEELKRKNVTVLFVSHDLGLVKRLAHRAAFMLHGKVEALGSPNDVVNRYVGMVLERQKDESAADGNAGQRFASSFRHGDGGSHIIDVGLLDRTGKPIRAVPTGEPVTVRVRAEFAREEHNAVVGMLIRNRLGMDVFGTNTRLEGRELGAFVAGDQLEVDFTFDCLLTQQDYTLTVATQHWDGSSQDWLDDVFSFSVVDPKNSAGVANFKTAIAWRKL